ncbi:MAG: prolyl-tRNA synthetase associated domain-containing protein [SAR324 cluster bacterium]|nr:prolyl-tRNA synthetase associated domain-containing protein [SAR324 cluster bacterium]MEC8981746.1 prolyl-tRNA synthetase associated domain-containing protein [SAR324 cluster bacterium]MEC9010972.1 prolyl-tRNA synthetase associated domain-containing protein [SAR324 cluster bacterium]MEC9459840.1 prolyl-tRNA synthetase associated domain-containing protein [SAR324 cluster bacterium]MED5402572.1 prolyl-tRNA synthetase associated domain-containing protein [SAR324 cluster bacterium]
MKDIYEFLEANQVEYERHDHEAVFTVEESKKLSPELEGASTKNLFLRDKKGSRHFLVTVPEDKQVDLKALSGKLDCSRLSFASPERLKTHLGIEPGSVSLLALANDNENKVEAFIDQDIWQAEAILCHPLVNTSTLVIPREDMGQFLEKTGHGVKLIEV